MNDTSYSDVCSLKMPGAGFKKTWKKFVLRLQLCPLANPGCASAGSAAVTAFGLENGLNLISRGALAPQYQVAWGPRGM